MLVKDGYESINIVFGTRKDEDHGSELFKGSFKECQDYARALDPREFYRLSICQDNGIIVKRIDCQKFDQKAYTAAYNKAHYERIDIRVPKGTKDKWNAIKDELGEKSMASMIEKAVELLYSTSKK